ncbi:MAG: hypothetical protein JNJ53_06300 [Rhizobiales bacterium]|nr:hypothetical protein [Hyphomicrobiales bacterium]
MRILTTVTLSVSLMIAAPVLAGFEPMPQPQAKTQSANETVVSKTAPDGTWPFALKQESSEPVVYYSI